MSFGREWNKFMKHGIHYLKAEFNNGVDKIQDAVRSDSGQAIATGLSILPVPIISDIGKAMVEYDNKMDALEQHEADKQWQSEEAEKAREHATSEREASFADNVKMWEMNNAYNEERIAEQREYDSLSSQVERARQAGLSPQVVADGGGKATDTNQANSPTSSPASSPSAGAPSSIASQMLTSDAQIASLMSNVRKNDSESELNKQTFEWNTMTKSERYSSMINNLKLQDAQIKSIISSSNLTEQQAEELKQTIPYLKDKNETELKLMKEQINATRNQWLMLQEDIANLRKQRVNIGKHGKLLDAQIASEEADKVIADTQAKIMELQRQQLKIVVDFSDKTGIPFGTDKFAVAWALHEKGAYTEYLDVITDVSYSEHSKALDRQLLVSGLKFPPAPPQVGDVVIDAPQNGGERRSPKSDKEGKTVKDIYDADKRQKERDSKREFGERKKQQDREYWDKKKRTKSSRYKLPRVSPTVERGAKRILNRALGPMSGLLMAPMFPWQDPTWYGSPYPSTYYR